MQIKYLKLLKKKSKSKKKHNLQAVLTSLFLGYFHLFCMNIYSKNFKIMLSVQLVILHKNMKLN